MNAMISLTGLIGIMGILLGLSSLLALILNQDWESVTISLLFGQSAAPYALALILGGAAVLAISLVAATLRGLEL